MSAVSRQCRLRAAPVRQKYVWACWQAVVNSESRVVIRGRWERAGDQVHISILQAVSSANVGTLVEAAITIHGLQTCAWLPKDCSGRPRAFKLSDYTLCLVRCCEGAHGLAGTMADAQSLFARTWRRKRGRVLVLTLVQACSGTWLFQGKALAFGKCAFVRAVVSNRRRASPR